MKFWRLSIFLIFPLLLFSCGSTNVKHCAINEKDSIIVRWGEYVSAEKTMHGWYIGKDRIIYEFNGTESEIVNRNKVAEVDVDEYCNLLKSCRKMFLSNKILNVPAGVNHFIQYEDKQKDMTLISLWVPEHLNAGNTEFKKLFLELTKQLPEANILKQKLMIKEKFE